MKTIFTTLLIILTFSQGIKAQFTTNKNISTTPKITSGISQSKLPALTKVNLSSIENKTLESLFSSSIPSIPSPEELERARVKSWEIKPDRPVIQGLNLQFHGIYSPRFFRVIPQESIPGSSRSYFLPNSNILTTNLLAGKDYKLTLMIQRQLGIASSGRMIFDLGEGSYQVEVKEGQQEVVFFFSSTTSGDQFIGFGPIYGNLIPGNADARGYDLLSVKLEELTVAK